MISNMQADAVIAMAKHEMKRDSRRPAQSQRHEALGDYVMLVFDAATCLNHDLPYSTELAGCTDEFRCRQILLSTAI